jgi:hypothetical protein
MADAAPTNTGAGKDLLREGAARGVGRREENGMMAAGHGGMG